MSVHTSLTVAGAGPVQSDGRNGRCSICLDVARKQSNHWGARCDGEWSCIEHCRQSCSGAGIDSKHKQIAALNGSVVQAAKHFSVPVVVCTGMYKLSPLYPSDLDALIRLE